MRKLFILMACIPMLLQAQEDSKGIRFVKWLSWEQVKAKANAENKYIFIDVFATWCGPCKMMDREVYPDDTVGSLVNAKFIAVKLQMDSGAKDNEDVKSWYATAKDISSKYTIPGFPSFLFFSPDGKLVYKDLGYKNVADFVKLLDKALDPQSPLYYGQLEDYKKGQINYATIGGLASFVEKVIGDKDQAKSIAKDYKENYLDNLSEEDLFTRENFDFIGEFYDLMNSNDNFFHLCYDQPGRVDTLMQGQGWAMNMINNTLILEIDRKLNKANKPVFKNPDWSAIRFAMKSKYSKVDVKKLVLDYQIYYYGTIANDWEMWFTYKDQKIQEYPAKPGVDNYMQLNVSGAWYAFKNCNDKEVLAKTLRWIDLAIKLDGLVAEYLDTKAMILYKLGRVKEAISFEHKAIEVDEELEKKQGKAKGSYAKPFYVAIAEMKKGEPTYLEEGAIWNVNTLPKKFN